MEETFGAHKVILTHSCTGALEMAAMLAEIKPGDEVLMPSFTFVTTASAFVRAGAKPVFVDIRPDTLNLDERLLEPAITVRTKAIVPVHYAGVACAMDSIMSLAAAHNLLVVEDAAQAVGATDKGRHLGTIGHLGCYSFHDTKNISSGEGGALVINDDRFTARAEIIRDKGTNRQSFLRGQVDKYTWVDLGSSFLASELTAAMLLAQLEESFLITAMRQRQYSYYLDQLQPLAAADQVTVPYVPAGSSHNAHIFYLITADEATRNALMTHLRQREIKATFHYVPLHTSPMGQHFGYTPGDLPVTEALAGRLIRLPLYFGLEQTDQARVIAAIYEFYGHPWHSQNLRESSSCM